MDLKKIIIPLLLLAGCTYNQKQRIAEKLAPITHSHNMKIIRESLERPSSLFSFHLIPGKVAFILKGSHIPVGERFLFASIDGATGKIDILNEFKSLSDGSIDLFDRKGPRNEISLNFQVHENVLVGKQIDYILVRKKDCTFAKASFLPYPLEAKGNRGERASLLVTHPMLTRFYLQASGFSPNESIEMVHRSGERVEIAQITADQSGQIEAHLNPVILGKLGGEASLTLSGKNGSIELNYPWGASLEKQTFANHRTFPVLFVANQLPHERDQDPFASRFFSVN